MFLEVYLTFEYVMVDRADSHRKVSVRIKASKTDQFREGVDIYLGRSGQALCPVSAMLAYLVRRKDEQGPPFKFEDGKPLTGQRLVKEVKQVLDEAGTSSVGISSHSFRIGAAMIAAERGEQDSTLDDEKAMPSKSICRKREGSWQNDPRNW